MSERTEFKELAKNNKTTTISTLAVTIKLYSVIVFNALHSRCILTDVPEVHVSRVQEVSLVNHVPHPLAVVHVTLTSLYAGK